MPFCASLNRHLSHGTKAFLDEILRKSVEVNVFRHYLPVAVSLALLSCKPETYSSTRDGNNELSAAIVPFCSNRACASGKSSARSGPQIHKLLIRTHNKHRCVIVLLFSAIYNTRISAAYKKNLFCTLHLVPNLRNGKKNHSYKHPASVLNHRSIVNQKDSYLRCFSYIISIFHVNCLSS